MEAKLIPGAAQRAEDHADHGAAGDVDLISIVERLRNVPRAQSNLGFAEPVSPQLQPGDPGYKKPEPAARDRLPPVTSWTSATV